MEAATTTIGRSLQTKNGAPLKFVQNNTDRNVEVYVHNELHFSSLKQFGLKVGTDRAVMIGTSATTSEKGCKVWFNFRTVNTAFNYDNRLAQAGVSRVQFTPYKDEK